MKEVDAAVLIAYMPLDKYYASQLADLRDEMVKPIFFISVSPTTQRPGMSLLVRYGIPTFTIPERVLKVLSAMVHYSNYLRQS